MDLLRLMLFGPKVVLAVVKAIGVYGMQSERS